MRQTRTAVLTGMILTAAALRLVPHPPNFSPITAVALFGGAQFSKKRFAFAVPFAALLLSDAFLGFYPGMLPVYGSFALVVCLGLWLRSRRHLLPITAAALASSLVFFVVTNFAVWAAGTMYPMTLAGLAACYTAAIPFFQNTLVGDAFFTVVLFGGFALAQRRWPFLAEPAPAVAV